MSTKTTFKRIALVAVAALGFGMLSTGVASATDPLKSTGFSLNADSITVVGASGYGVFEVTLADDQDTSSPLFDGESITATVSNVTPKGVSTATAAADLSLVWDTAAHFNPITGASSGSLSSKSETVSSSDAGMAEDLGLTAAARGGDDSTSTATYLLKVGSTDGTKAVDMGTYSINISLLDTNGNAIATKSVKFTVVTNKLTSGAVLSAASAGLKAPSTALYTSATNYVTATITDANGGLVREGNNAEPTLSGTLTDAATTPVAATAGLTFADNGSTGNEANGAALDGTFNVAGTVVSAPTAGSGTLTISYGASTPATATVVLSGASSGYGSTSITAAGGVATTGNYVLPLTSKSITNTITVVDNATLTSGTAVTGKSVYYSVSYGAGCVKGDMSPKAVAGAKLVTDSSGQASVTVTNANPIEGATACVATIAWSGTGATTTPAGYVSRTFTWKKPVATTIVASTGSYSALLASTHAITWTVLDQFGAAMAGQTVTLDGSGANYPTTGIASKTTDASGQVSYTWTDAAGVVASTTKGSDTVGVATVGLTTISQTTGNDVTVTYKATLPVTASIKAEYDTTLAMTSAVLVPTTNIGGSAGKAISGNDQFNIGKTVTCANPGCVAVKFSPLTSADAAASGVPFTVTVDNGYIVDSAGYLVKSRTLYGATALWVTSTKTGVTTVTATMGTITKSAKIYFVNAAADARVISATTADGTVTATVTDAFGNAVSGVDVNVNITGGKLTSGSSYAQYKTATDGTVVFDVKGAATVTTKLDATAKSKYLAGYGDAVGAVETAGAPAGVSSATVTTTGITDTGSTATDAAAEATDAANAATDAANAAAEAADAATAAAQDAADAVAALSAQVATLISGLKAQLTALTNLVIKIQKKVKA